jgi:hypothetical protein
MIFLPVKKHIDGLQLHLHALSAHVYNDSGVHSENFSLITKDLDCVVHNCSC